MAVVPQSPRLDRRADRAGLAAVLVDDDFRLDLGAAEVRADEVDFRLDRREVVLRPALKHEPRAELGQVRDTCHVEKDVLRQDRRQTGKDFLRRPSLPLEIDDVGLHEHRAAVAEHRHRRGRERAIGELLHRNAEGFGGRLQEVAVPRGTLRVQLEVLDPPFGQHNQLDVLAADVDDDVRIGVVLDRRLGVGDGLDQRRIGGEHVLEHVFGVARRADAEDFEGRALRLHLAAQFLEDIDRVLDRVSFRQLIRLAEDVAVGRQQHALGGGRSAVEADERGDAVARGKCCGRETLRHVLALERLELFRRRAQPFSAGRRLFFETADIDVALERGGAGIAANRFVFGLAELDGAERGEVLGVLRRFDQRLGRLARRDLDAALGPHLRNVVLPGLAHAADERVRSAEQQHVRPQRVAARQHGQVLQHDGVEERRHQLVGRRAFLLQAVDVGLGEDAALARHLVQLDPQVALLAEVVRRNFQLRVDLVDHRAGAAGALVVHRRDLLFPPRFGVRLEDDDLGVLAAQLDHRMDFGVELFDRERDGRDFLDELRADQRRQVAAARPCNEHAAGVRSNLQVGLETAEELEGLLRLLRLVALVVRPDHLIRGRIHGNGLDRGRSDVDADK